MSEPMKHVVKLVENPSTNDKDSRFNKLDEDWRKACDSSSDEELKKRIYGLVEEEEENQKNKDADEDLSNAKAAVSTASQQYRDATKGYKLRVKYIMWLLRLRGKA